MVMTGEIRALRVVEAIISGWRGAVLIQIKFVALRQDLLIA